MSILIAGIDFAKYAGRRASKFARADFDSA
jgi:hypothetical protein